MAHSSDRYGPPGGGRHRLVGYGDPTGPVLMGRHSDTPEGRADDWLVDERDEHAHGDEACDVTQQQPDRWVGVQRSLDVLPVTPAPSRRARGPVT